MSEKTGGGRYELLNAVDFSFSGIPLVSNTKFEGT